MSRNRKRILKVYYGHHSNSYKQHPVIRLGGFYLSSVDFKIGDAVEVTLEHNQIVIKKIEPKNI